jgi:hypothetical protein
MTFSISMKNRAAGFKTSELKKSEFHFPVFAFKARLPWEAGHTVRFGFHAPKDL